jgi:hypothetical protein
MRPKQESVIERLEKETVSRVRDLEDTGVLAIRRLWNRTAGLIRQDIAGEYTRDFHRSTWNIVLAARFGTLNRIDQRVGGRLREFHEASLRYISGHLRELYKTSVLRNAWILDQVTPPSYQVRLPHSSVVLESMREGATVYQGPDVDTSWKVRWNAWTDAYRGSLNQNLKLGAMNESTLDDALDEVDATQPGTPRSSLLDALERVYRHQAETTYIMGQGDVREANPDFEITEIWQNRYYKRVCEDCEMNQGLEREEADGEIPLHPNCGCYWRMVPKSWAELLRSGNHSDRELARMMDAQGVVPNTMVVLDDNGNMVGSVIMTFDKWAEGQAKVIATR